MTQRHPGHRGQVMLVEDDYAIRETLRELLEEEGYQVAEAANGAEALAQLRAVEIPRLILLDLMMPVMDGWEFRSAIQNDPRLAGIPVIVLSADNGLAQKARAMRVQGFLPKPFELGELLTAIEPYAEG